MPKKRISANRNKASRKSVTLKRHGFIGLALAGGKSDKTCLAHVEYYPSQKKIFLSQLVDSIKTEADISADLILHEEIVNRSKHLSYLAYNVPLSLPKCLTCRLRCPGFENCNEEEILWMWDHYRKLQSEGVDKKLFTPYTERCIEQYLATELEEPFHLQHALGANQAPLTARALFLNRSLKIKSI